MKLPTVLQIILYLAFAILMLLLFLAQPEPIRWLYLVGVLIGLTAATLLCRQLIKSRRET